MKKKIWILAAIIAAVVLFFGAYLLYDKLSGDYSQSNLAQTNPSQSSDNRQESDDGSNATDGGGSQDYTAPDFTVTDADGNEVKLSSYFGKPIVLNFWASWCPPCKEEMPHFEQAFKSHGEVQFLMVNVTMSDRETLEAAKKHISDNGYTFPVLYDTSGEAMYTYGTSSLPTTFFIDSDGQLVTYAKGMISAETLEQGIGFIAEN